MPHKDILRGLEEASNFSNACGCNMSSAYGDQFSNGDGFRVRNNSNDEDKYDYDNDPNIPTNDPSQKAGTTTTNSTSKTPPAPVAPRNIGDVLSTEGFFVKGNFTFPYGANATDQFGNVKFFASGTVVKGEVKADGTYFIEANKTFLDIQNTQVFRITSALKAGGTIPTNTVINNAPIASGTKKVYVFVKNAIAMNERDRVQKQFLKDAIVEGYLTTKTVRDETSAMASASNKILTENSTLNFICVTDSTFAGGQVLADYYLVPLWFLRDQFGTKALADDPDSILDFTAGGTIMMSEAELREKKFYKPTSAETGHMMMHAQLNTVFNQIQRYMVNILLQRIPAMDYEDFYVGDLIFKKGGLDYAWIGTTVRIFPTANSVDKFAVAIGHSQNPLPVGVSLNWNNEGTAFEIQKALVFNVLLNLRIGQTRQNSVAINYDVQDANQSQADWDKEVMAKLKVGIQNANTQAQADALSKDVERTVAEKARQDEALRNEIENQSVAAQAKYEEERRMLGIQTQTQKANAQAIANAASISKMQSDSANQMSQLQKMIADSKAKLAATQAQRNATLNAPVNPTAKIQTNLTAAGKAYYASGQASGGADIAFDFAKNPQGSNGRFDEADSSNLLTNQQFVSQMPSNQQQQYESENQYQSGIQVNKAIPDQELQQKSGSKTWIWVTVVIVVLAAAGGAGYYFWQKSKQAA